MKSIIILLLLMTTSSFAQDKSYTPLGYSTLAIEAVMESISVISSEEYAPNPWPGYLVTKIEVKENGMYQVSVTDEWTEGSPKLSFNFEVKEKECEFSACGFEASLLLENQ